MRKTQGWIGVDLDGVLAEYSGLKGPTHIGNPIPKMVRRVKKWLKEGKDIRIMTARVSPIAGNVRATRLLIEMWCEDNIGVILPITNEKDPHMVELWDDRAVQMIPNTGERADGKE